MGDEMNSRLDQGEKFDLRAEYERKFRERFGDPVPATAPMPQAKSKETT